MTYSITFPDNSSINVAWAGAPPAATGMLIGNTPRGTSDASGVAAVDAVYGAGSLIRLYNSGSLTLPVVADRKAIGSFKTVSGSTKAEMDAYYSVFYQHEIDSKIAKGQITLAQWKTDMTTLKNLGSSKLAICVTADCFVNANKNPHDYLIPGITHWGVDFDGISGSSYHSYSTALANVVSFANANGLTIGVPEFGANQTPTDTDGHLRAAWMTSNMRSFQDAGFQYACFWEQTSQSGSTFTTAAEVACVSSALRLGPR